MDNQSMREMNKVELIANLSLNDLADIIIMERQHIREIKERHNKLVEILQENISALTRENAVLEKALELMDADFTDTINKLNKYEFMLIPDRRNYISQAEQEVK